jgi:hypothetical protein
MMLKRKRRALSEKVVIARIVMLPFNSIAAIATNCDKMPHNPLCFIAQNGVIFGNWMHWLYEYPLKEPDVHESICGWGTHIRKLHRNPILRFSVYCGMYDIYTIP